MPGITRKGDPLSAGDVTDKSSSDVFAGGGDKLVVRKDDKTAGSGSIDTSPATFKTFSPNTFANNVNVVRVGDKTFPGETVISGSTTVFVNSSGGGGAVVDNNTPFEIDPITGAINITPANPNVQTVIPAGYRDQAISESHIQFYETDDQATASPSLPPGVTFQDRQQQQQDTTAAPTNVPPVQSCTDVNALAPTFSWNDVSPGDFDGWAQSFQLSPNFSVYDLTVATAISTYRFTSSSTQPVGLTQKSILLNLCYLANTVLEPMRTRYGTFTITSCWRNATNGSQHNKGQAADIQFPSFHSSGSVGELYFERAKDLRDNINFDQEILEWFGVNPWLHVSVNPSGHRHNVLTQVTKTTYQSGLILLG